jgi:hypothetical protein
MGTSSRYAGIVVHEMTDKLGFHPAMSVKSNPDFSERRPAANRRSSASATRSIAGYRGAQHEGIARTRPSDAVVALASTLARSRKSIE